jgi:hypothetical protein
MAISISGGRGDGTPWPDAGGVLEVDAEEGAALVAGKMAVAVPEPPPPPRPKTAKPQPVTGTDGRTA